MAVWAVGTVKWCDVAAVYAHTHYPQERECACGVWMRGEEEDGGAAHLANTTDTPRVCGVECGGVCKAGREALCGCAVRDDGGTRVRTFPRYSP